MPFPYSRKNLAISAVATAPSPATSGTSLIVTTGHGARFPVAPFPATIWPATGSPDPSNAEVVLVTAVSTDTLTIVRAREGTTARTVVVTDRISASITSAVDDRLEWKIARGNIALWVPQGNATTVPGILGLPALSAIGTATTRNVATTSKATRMRRIGYPSAATAGSLGGARNVLTQYSAGSGADDGSGFRFIERWVESDGAAVSGRRAFAGFRSSTSAPTNVEPNTLTDTIGVGQLSTDATQWYWIQGGSAAQTAVACGTGVGAPAGNSTTAWELEIYAPPMTANTFLLTLTNLTTDVSVTRTMGTSATVVPQSSTLLCWQHWCCNNATALAVGCEIGSLYYEQFM